MKVHLIAIGGSAMHNMAIALQQKGFEVTGSDDEIFEPSKSRLAARGLLPKEDGWFAENIHERLDAVIVGMHARADNPELLRAKELGLRIFSYPEYIFEQSKEKTRIVIGGSHGKTSTTAMILHVMKVCGMEYDYLVGAQLEGFDCMVKFSEEARYIVIEGDEYLSSPIDRRPKFHLYQPHIAVITGIAWDHINVFPTFENYVQQFSIFIDKIESGGTLVYCQKDKVLEHLVTHHCSDVKRISYTTHPHDIVDGITRLETLSGKIPIAIFGDHNLQNLSAALEVCRAIGIDTGTFYDAIASFKGAARRLELVNQTTGHAVYKDFAHSPSKLKATTEALKKQYPNRKLIACMELHTFSSLNANFLQEYHGSMAQADEAFVYFNPHTIEHKKLTPITPAQVVDAFGGKNICVYTDSAQLRQALVKRSWNNTNLLLMTSGNFDGIDFLELAKQIEPEK
jgi:UDP-N-acetylmuramate: L-alanyl-gamma-D-glutamyl-meso-diaminopimelate ligase